MSLSKPLAGIAGVVAFVLVYWYSDCKRIEYRASYALVCAYGIAWLIWLVCALLSLL